MSEAAPHSSPLDVLAPDLAAVLIAWLAQELLDDRYAPLDTLGAGPEKRISLAHVFVDLAEEGLEARLSPAPSDTFPTLPPAPGLLASLLASGRSGAPIASAQPSPHTLLVGGPGQGKSTLVQVLCQIHRAFVLAGYDDLLEVPAREARDELLARCARECLTPTPLRLPVRIVLRDFAAWLARHPTLSPSEALFAHLIERVRAATARTVEPSDLALALDRLPWLLVLDGLDEVPGAGGRDATLEAVRVFTTRLSNVHPIIATTRPQGYAGELDHFTVLRLAPLSLHRALWYARELVTSWLPDQTSARKRLLDRILQAAHEDATARLMLSPLQVTIMALLLERVSRAPHERWRLYKLYFNTIYDRELNRRSDTAELLRSQRPHIEAIHARVALHLHIACEAEGTTAAFLSRDALLAIVHARLAEHHPDEIRRKALAEAIVGVAAERLVFLVSPQADLFGFELRSFQEFLAAEAIMNSREQTTASIIRRIAPSTHWRNVLLFAISACLANSHSLTEAFTVDLCEQLDTDPSDPPSVALRLGTGLALDILHEGSALYYPALTLRLLRRAVTRLSTERMDEVLARLHSEPELATGAAQIVVEALRPSVMAPDAAPGNDWVILNAACKIGLGGAEKLASVAWASASAQRKQEILALLPMPNQVCPWLTRTVGADLAAFHPADFGGHIFMMGADTSEGAWLLTLNRCRGLHRVISSSYFPLDVEIAFLDPSSSPAPFSFPETPSWQAFARVLEFTESPSVQSLAAALRALGHLEDRDQVPWQTTPWPLACAVEAADSPTSFEALAELAEAGGLGERASWFAAQERWSAHGLVREDFEAYARAGSRPSAEMARAGFPYLFHYGAHLNSRDPAFGPILALLYREAESPQARVLFGFLLQWPNWSGTQDLTLPLEIFTRLHYGFIPISVLTRPDIDLDELDLYARSDKTTLECYGVWPSLAVTSRLAARLADEVRRTPRRSGLRRVLTAIALRDPAVAPEVEEALATRASDDWAGRTAGVLWRLSRMSLTTSNAVEWAEELIVRSDDLSRERGWNIDFVFRRLPADMAEVLLLVLLDKLSNSNWLAWKAREFLYRLRQRRRSGLHDPDVWRALHLPEPPPTDLPVRMTLEDEIDEAVYRLDSLAITNLRAFDRFELRAAPPENDHGQWIIVVGENGVGKTTLLRSLALALTTQANASTALAMLPALLRRSTEVAATIVVSSRGRQHELAIVEEGASEIIRWGEGDPQRPFLLVAYGCRRGSAIGGPDRALLTEPIHDIHTLFDDTESGLNHTETWLQRRQHRALEDGEAAHVFEAVKDALIKILPGVETIHVDSYGVRLEGPQIGHARLGGLSDGYVTTLGWICDLMARWIFRMEQRGRPIPADFPAHMTGLVLIDEIDLHLHPRWQLRVIDDVRRLFPRMSFVVTTHSPLTLLGAQPGELHVLRAGDHPGGVQALQLDLLKGLRADQVLTGVWFGVTSTVDPDTIELMQRHRALVRGGAKLGDSTVAELEVEIRRRLGPLSPVLEQLVAHLRDATGPRTPEEHAAIRQDILDLAARRKAQRGGSSSGA